MGYSADSFSAGEAPTTSKWNKLWSNDASFNDGTGISNIEIGSGHTSLKNDYKFSAYRNAALSTSSIVTFDTKLYDTGTNYSTSTGLFTAPVAGFYIFNACVVVSLSSVAGLTCNLQVNASTSYTLSTTVVQGTSSTYSGGGALTLSLAANDTVQVNLVGGTYTISTGVGTHFQGFLISQT